MNRLLTFFIISVCLLAWSPAGSAQTLREMQASEVPAAEQKPVIVLDPNESILVVHTTIPDMNFESTQAIYGVDNPNPGEYHLHLEPGTHIVTFKAEGYKFLKERIYIPRKEARQVKITPKSFSESWPQVTLWYNSSPGETVTGSLDGAIPMKYNFSSGMARLRPPPGEHTIRLNSGGRIWEESFEVQEGQSLELEVQFSAQVLEDDGIQEPGNLYITSTPSWATVYMNQLEQGTTPLTMNDVQPGLYTVEAVKPHYLSQTKEVQAESETYTPLSFELTPDFGKLHIASQPPGAAVYLNGTYKGDTPYSVEQCDAGQYSMRLVKPKYYDYEAEFEMTPGGSFTETYTLNPQFGTLRISSSPSGATVYLDGQQIGKTPLTQKEVGSGSHTLRVTLGDLYKGYETQITIADGQTLEEYCPLGENFVTISVRSQPAGARVSISGTMSMTRTTPSENLMLPPGQYTVRIEKEDYLPLERNLMMSIGDAETINENLVRKTGNINISTQPQGAKIYLDNRSMGETPTVLKEIPTGRHDIRLDKPGYDIIVGEVGVRYNETIKFKRTLSTRGMEEWAKRRNSARWLSLVAPGSGQWISGQGVRGAIYEVAILGTAALAFMNYQNHSDSQDKFDEARDLYDNATTQSELDRHFAAMEEEVDNMEISKNNFNMFLYAAAGVYAIQVIDAWIFGGGKRPTMTASLDDPERKIIPLAYRDEAGVKVGFCIKF